MLENYSRKYSKNTTKIKSIAITQSNAEKLKRLDINFSRLLNDLLQKDGHLNIKLESNFDFKNRKITSLSIDEINLEKLDQINVTQLVNTIIENL